MSSSKENKQPHVPFDFLHNLLRSWWLQVVGVVLGAGLAFGIHTMFPPVYQAQAAITVGIDFSRTGYLTDVEEDFMVIVTGKLIRSDAVIEAALQAAQERGLKINRAEFDRQAFLQRRFTDWLLIVRSPDPLWAADVSNFWADAAWEVLTEAMSHTLRSDQLQRYLDIQVSCLEQTTVIEPVNSVCETSQIADIQEEIADTAKILHEEKLAAMGLVPGTLLSFNERAQMPSAPALFGRNSQVLAGGLIGFLVTTVWIFVNPYTRRRHK